MISISKYSANKKDDWNKFVSNSKNGFFLFDRDYMEYHSDRFRDFSLMIYDKDELAALFPANIDGDLLVSHGGLTFGGFITNSKMKAFQMLEIFDNMLKYLESESICRIIYKSIPPIYSSIPSEEDRYALFRVGAKLIRRDISSSIYLPKRSKFQERRLRWIKKAASLGLKVKETDDFDSFWEILEKNLEERHKIKPVHSIEEIKYLHSKFPNNIRLFASYKNDTMLAGVVVYESQNVAHSQYSASNFEGQSMGSLDSVYSHLINYYSNDKIYFDFGISTEENGHCLNEGLIFFKEGFGARAIVHDFYEVDIK